MSNTRLVESQGYLRYFVHYKSRIAYNRIAGKTDRIDLTTFYPFLALLAEVGHTHPDKPLHRALTRAIVNAPNPRQPTSKLPDGSAAKVVLLGRPIPESEINTRKWWPSADSNMARSKLFRRILREGFIVPIVTAIAVSLLTEIYTTTYVPASISVDGKATPRVRLQHRKSPLTDFGIAKGVADVKPQDKLAYIHDKSFSKGQDPNDHYWLYFTTLNGEEITIELNMYTFNFGMLVDTRPCSSCLDLSSIQHVPAFFRDKEIADSAPDIAEERERFSVLRNTNLQKVAMSSNPAEPLDESSLKLIYKFMDALAGRKCTEGEKKFLTAVLKPFRSASRYVVATQAWKGWPGTPYITIEEDPGDPECFVDDNEAWRPFHREWKEARKNERPKEELTEIYRKHEKMYPGRGQSSMDDVD